jgi:mono/diheme cytochrome c family protein
MKTIRSIVLVVLMTLILAACGESGTSAEPAPLPAAPAEYAGKTNPFAGNAEAIAAGKELYTANCATCHGDTGKGDGPVGASLDPKPADLSDPALDAKRADDFMAWRVSEGVTGTSMPAWKAMFSEEQIWQVIAYVRTFAAK